MGELTIASDHMEVGSLIAAIAMTHGEATITDAVPEHLRMTRSCSSGSVSRRRYVATMYSWHARALPHRTRPRRTIPEVKPQQWPGSSDLTSIATAFAKQADGSVMIHEWMFDRSLYFVDTSRGRWARRSSRPTARCRRGPSRLHARSCAARLRAGMALLARGRAP